MSGSKVLLPVFLAYALMQRLMRVFFPMSTTESPLSHAEAPEGQSALPVLLLGRAVGEEAAPSPDAPAAVGRMAEGRRRLWRGRVQGRGEAVVVGRTG
jgi:hypothetical protein